MFNVRTFRGNCRLRSGSLHHDDQLVRPHTPFLQSASRNISISGKNPRTAFSTQKSTSPQFRQRYLHSTASRRSTTAPSTPLQSAPEHGGDVFCDRDPAPNEHPGTVATVTISNPKRLNSLGRNTIRKLTEILQSLAIQPDLRCVVIRGGTTATKSPAFTSGANIFEMANLKSFDDAKVFITELHGVCQAMWDIPAVTIAKINGLCLGGGLELAAACDFRYVTKDSTFSMPETKYGIPSVIEARRLANIIGWQKTKEMVYLAKFYNAAEVETWGLVDKCCNDMKELDDVVADVVRTITSYGPKAMREQKRLCNLWEENDLKSGIEAGISSFARMFEDGGTEPHQYMKMFTERKK